MRSLRFLGADDFREIWWQDLEVETISGRLGTNGRAHTRSFETIDQADDYVRQTVARWRRQGFEPAEPDDPAEEPSERLLLAGWEGVQPVVVGLWTRGVNAIEVQAWPDDEHACAEDDLAAGSHSSRQLATREHAAEWVKARAEELRAQGYRRFQGEPTLEGLSPLPAALASLQREAQVLTECGLTRAWFGGWPRLDPDEAWPRHPRTRRPMSFVALLSPAGVPCTEIWLDTLHNEQRAWCRTRPTAPAARRKPPAGVQVFEPQRNGLREHPDLPCPQDLQLSFATYARRFPRPLRVRHCFGDKLGGWPSWIQQPRSMRCQACAQDMELHIQLAQHPLGWMWGTDAGRLLVFCCPRCGAFKMLEDGS